MEQGNAQGKQAIDRLVGLGHMRVWSVIITIFGDAVVGRGGVVAASTLAALTEQMGVKPEAFRVALSRLTKDGWITRSKKGRLSFYQLSPSGVAEFGPATARIYATESGSAAGWQLILRPAAVSEELPEGAVSLGGRAFLAAPEVRVPDGLAVAGPIDMVPGWVQDRISVPDIAQGYNALSAALQGLPLDGLSDLEAATVRVLIVHQWRRLILRHADLPPRFFRDDWQGETCRTLVHQALAQLSGPSGRWFDAQIS